LPKIKDSGIELDPGSEIGCDFQREYILTEVTGKATMDLTQVTIKNINNILFTI